MAIATVLITQANAPSYPNGRVMATMLGGGHGIDPKLTDQRLFKEFCEVFEPCAGFGYSDSILHLITQQTPSMHPLEGEQYRLGATLFAYLEFDDNLVVRRFELGTFLSADSLTRSQVESILVPVYREYFAKHIVGSRIRESALSACGGRVYGQSCDDGFARKDSVGSPGNMIYTDRSGTLMLRIRTGRPRSHGFYPYDVRLALVNIRIRE